MPDNDAFILWAKVAFGPSWGFTVAWIDWFACVIDNTLYPVLFLNYLLRLSSGPWSEDQLYVILVQVGVVAFVMVINLLGVDLVGHFSFLFTVFIVSPFFVLLVWSGIKGKLDPSSWIEAPPEYGEGIVVALNIAIWSYSGYDSIGAISEELVDSEKNFTPAMITIILSSIATYMISFVSTVGIDTDYSNWVDGYFAVVAGQLGGNGLKTYMGVAALVSALGTFNALLCASAQSFRALGKKDLLNAKILLWKHPKFRTPWAPIIINCFIIALLASLLDFTGLLYFNNSIYAMLLLFQYASLITLRYTKPDMRRPYRISQSNFLTILLCVPPVIVCVYILATAAYYAWIQTICAAFILISGKVTFHILDYLSIKRKAYFNTPKKPKLVLLKDDTGSVLI